MQAEGYQSCQQRRALDVILTDGRTAALNVVCRGDWSLASWSDGGADISFGDDGGGGGVEAVDGGGLRGFSVSRRLRSSDLD